MNVIVSYKQKDIIDNANIDAIKDLNGLFNVADLIDKFKNYFFSKMILDATSVENFASREVLTQLVDGIGADRLIILLPQTPPPPDEFKKLLIDLRIYNFSNDINDIVKFIDTPNTYENVIGTVSNINSSNDGYVDNSIKGNNGDMFNPLITENGSINQEKNEEIPEHDEHSSFERALNRVTSIVDNNTDINKNISKYEEYTEDKFVNTEDKDNNHEDVDKLKKDVFNSDSKDDKKQGYIFLNMSGFDNFDESSNNKRIIGFKDITLHAGSTSLIYMLLKTTISKLKKDAIAIEINKNEFRLFMNKKMFSVNEKEALDFIKSRSESVIFVDLNDCDNCDFCDEVIYLVEPSIIMLNRLMAENQNIFKTLVDKKVVLNKCLLSKDDIKILSSEAKINFMYSFEPLNDRADSNDMMSFLEILGIK